MTLSGMIEQRVTIPAGVTASVDGSIVTVKGKKATLQRELSYPKIKIRMEGERWWSAASSPVSAKRPW